MFTCQRKTTFQIIRTLFRVTYGNIYYEQFPFEVKLGADDESGDRDLVSVYIPGQESHQRCVKVITSFQGRIFDVPDNIETGKKNAIEALENFRLTLNMSKKRQEDILTEAAKYVDFWHEMVLESKNVTNALNMF